MHLSKLVIVFNILIIIASNSFSQPLVTDRPDQTESAITIPKYSLQLETGFAYESLRENDISIDNYSLASTLIRYGLVEYLELRFGGSYLITTEVNTNYGLGNFLAGLKINFINEEGNSFAFGLLAQVLLPFGEASFNPPNVDPQLIAAISKSVSDRISIAANLGVFHSSLIEEVIYLYTGVVGLTFTNSLSMFLEIYGKITPSYTPIINFDGGFTYLLTNDFQLDLSTGKGISGVDSIWFLSSGISFRFMNL